MTTHEQLVDWFRGCEVQEDSGTESLAFYVCEQSEEMVGLLMHEGATADAANAAVDKACTEALGHDTSWFFGQEYM